MADLTVTATTVAPTTGANQTVIDYGQCGETITAGQSVYVFDATTSPKTYKKADADASSAAAAGAGVSLNGGAVGQPLAVATGGIYTAGATVVVGKPYFVSATAGGIAPAADLATGMFVTLIGVGITAATIQLNVKAFGVATP